jgi:hypothetical protein
MTEALFFLILLLISGMENVIKFEVASISVLQNCKAILQDTENF